MARYVMNGNQTINSTPDTAMALNAPGSAMRRVKVVEFTWGAEGSATPADTIITMHMGRITTAGTGTAAVELPLDPADAASLALVSSNHTAEPTYTNDPEPLWRVGRHMRATYRWVAAPGAEFLIPATANAGIGFRPEHTSAVTNEEIAGIYDEQ